MLNPFSGEQIKNYLLLYVAVIIIVILFYFLNASFNSTEVIKKKIFETNASSVTQKTIEEGQDSPKEELAPDKRIRLLDKAY